MKVVSVMTTSSRGGAEFAAIEMLDALIDRGHEAVMLTDQPLIGRDTRVTIRPIAIGPKLSRTSYMRLALRWPNYLLRLRAALEREWPYDVLLVHYKKEQLMARWLPERLRATLVWAEWGPVPFQLRRGLPQRMYLRAARNAATVMAVSQGTKDSVCAVGVPAAKVEVVPNVLRTGEIAFTAEGRARLRAELAVSDDDFVVGCISRFHPKKRNDVVVEAVKLLDDRVHLVLAGDGETESELRRIAAPLGGRAHFMPTPGANVADVLSAFDVSVFCPSPTEGAPRAVILGMLAERPCLATGPEGVADMITAGVGVIAEPENDPAALRAALAPYLEDPARRACEGAEARRRAVATYDAASVSERIERLWLDAGAGRTGRPEADPAEGKRPGMESWASSTYAANERPLRVVSVQTSHERGGGEYANVDVLCGLQTRGIDVVLLTNQPDLVEGTEVPVVEIDIGPKIRRTTLRRVTLGFPHWVLRLRSALERESRDKPIDVLLLHFKKEQLMSAILPRRLTGAVVWAEWGRLPGPVANGPARFVYLAAARRAKLIVAVSESTRDSLVRAGVPTKKVAVVHNIVDSETIVFDSAARERYRAEWSVAAGDFVLGCVSRLSASKRNDVIIDALAHLPQSVQLVFAGEGDNEAALRSRAAPYGDRVRFLPTPRGHVGELLSACDISVFAPQPVEGAPRSIIFGQLSERAVIASGPEGAAGMVAPGTGTIVSPAHDPRALAACIESYRLDSERCAREGRAGRALALERYDPQEVVDEWAARLRVAGNGNTGR
ncbi:MAG TPA: glycosyltransferase family 4 protein [Solirubrobacteraceae bacterium]|jgi:glycosyltransferase involved in cell wall biosynthesis|nr:glycosyltransferase family 4 protein [Solirubrobacteraceae bacterium]